MPARLLGTGGARVCCPACWLTFVIGPNGDLMAVIGRSKSAPARTGLVDHAPPAANTPPAPPVAADAADQPLDAIAAMFESARPRVDAPAADVAAPVDAAPAHDLDEALAMWDMLAAGMSADSATDLEEIAAPAASAAPTRSLAALLELDHPGGTLAHAAAQGRLFAAHGAALVGAFEALRRERPDADVAGEFRTALAGLTGIDLTAPSTNAAPRLTT